MGDTFSGNPNDPSTSHEPLPASLPVNIVFERLSSAGETKSPDSENADTQAREPEDEESHNPTQDEDVAQEKDSAPETDELSQDGSHGVEQLMRVAVQVPREFHHILKSGNGRCHVIMVADKSGSMAGNPWKQVQGALVDIVSTSLQREGVMVDLVTYSDSASHVCFTAKNYAAVINAQVAMNTTSFVAAMDTVDNVMRKRKGEAFGSTAIVFMTDGQDTCSKGAVVAQRLLRWRSDLRAQGREVSVHAVGFTSGHDFKFLQELSEAGTRPGLFRYCEPGDGPETLKLKVEELFDYAVYSAVETVEVGVEMGGENRILSAGSRVAEHSMPGEIIRAKQDDGTAEDGPGELTVQAEMWVWVPHAAELPNPAVSLNKTVVSDGEKRTVRVPCVCSGVECRAIEDAAGKAQWGLNVLSRGCDDLSTQIAIAIQEKKDVTALQKRMTRLQSRLSHTKVFGSGITSDLRSSLLASMKDIQAKMDVMHDMMARYSRGETASVSILARAHDLRYEAQFKKSRRKRLMDKRAVQNVSRAKADDARLENLVVDEAEVARLSQEAVGFFFCALSQESVVDILRDTGNKENAIGFGLAVCRPEYIIDSPTSLQLCLVSGTLVSRSSMLDALQYKVSLAGHLQAHNGFRFLGGQGEGQGQGQGSLGYATVGVGREPINAWLPLYVTPSHWDRVKVLMKPTLGYLCTLDPLGFDWAQLDVPFAVLGAMVGQLSPASTGTHQLRLLLCFLRTCVATVSEFNLTNRILDMVRTFLREPKGRLKNVLPNLNTLIGYIAALPVDKSRYILGYEEEGRDPDQLPRGLWLAFLAEMLRRAGGREFKGRNDRQLNIIVDLLLHGRTNSLMLPGTAQDAAATAQTSVNYAAKAQEATCVATDAAATVSTATTSSSSSSSSSSAQQEPTVVTSPTASSSSSSSSPPPPSSESARSAQAAKQDGGQRLAPDVISHDASARFSLLCGSLATCQGDLTIQGVEGEDEGGEEGEGEASKGEQQQAVADTTVTTTPPPPEFEHCPKMDAHMELWARAQLCGLENKHQVKKVPAAKKQVALWIKEGRQAAGLPDEDTTETKEEEVYDCDAVDSSVLEVTAKLLTRLLRGSSLPLSSVPGAMAFLHAWLSKDRDFEQMSDGLPPAQWVDDIKAAVARIYRDMHEFVSQCKELASADDVEEVVVVEGASKDSASGSRHRHRQGKQGVNEEDEDDDDDYSDYSDYEDYGHLDEDDPMKVLKRRQQEHQSLVTLPMVLHVLDPCENKVKVTRAMLCQAVVHSSNSSAKEAAGSGEFVDLKNEDGVEGLLRKLHQHIVTVSTIDHTDSIIWRRANVSLLASTSIWAFLGYLMNTYTERNEGFSWLLTTISLLDEAGAKGAPCLADKVKVMLTGRWGEHSVLARGNSLMPGPALSKKLKKVLGEEHHPDHGRGTVSRPGS
ncbi:uncharacterized protein LOC143301968 isoform X2 [Babylonia areolata]|uniref:uncharacterized protein LOC143301968 isoform X2 n=1 Tax=Babylonia areolata TaxID=304850 RepID=UPI003FD2400D